MYLKYHIYSPIFLLQDPYSFKMIDKLIEIRLLFKNSFNSEEILIIDNEFLDYEIYKKLLTLIM